uniref:Uncharacterized protein n=1 Tax=Siphoviridae sp. ct5jB2 TaxID=2825337 RepID=A0A8S5TTU6_9CAUD|nr:MAG TPA: hypothetical protein [Siphoviridae sp. ct5jB2]
MCRIFVATGIPRITKLETKDFHLHTLKILENISNVTI